MGTAIQMYAAGAGGAQDAVASIDVPANGNLIGIDWTIRAGPSGADFQVDGQCSFGSTGAFATNDARQVISNIKVGGDLTTSGATSTHANKYSNLPDLPVGPGERIYLHLNATAGLASIIQAVLYFDFDLDRPRQRTR